MGAKTALLAFAEGDIRPALLGATPAERAETEALVRRIHPGYGVVPVDNGPTLLDCVYPPDDITYATTLAGAELYCDRRLVLNRPSKLPEHLRQVGAGRRIIMHGMHSVVDWLGFAVWEDGVLVRSLSLSPDGGIQENIGEPYDFELPYWAGAHPVEPVPGWPDQPAYPLPFHPLELGEEALRALFGFVIEGFPDADDIDVDTVHLHGFRVTDPSGAEQAAREAMYAASRSMDPPRMFRMGPDGTMHEIS
ncbi:hypothetical protein EV644_1631 [Kribbella orskensis]|uniref:Uncharacterized protein n=1 Tax=Kribbella orskensis TaxID=2512216 RepID=A0ABY2B5V1_9ACTN|nr:MULTISPECIES: hypothetical protein [Kribbella]TCN26345.1 hypothetical protein EV642_1671 [Kribbella sp. VKM Ac-2500]TCO07172.1 hypothetical protein EV644_1631 [Kribbella orskensis]